MRLMKTVLWLALAVGMLLPGCTSMKAVQDYAVTSHKTLEGVQSVGKDFAASCERQNKYRPLNEYRECETEKTQAKGIQAAVAVLDAYVVALGALAADELVSYNKELDGLAKEVKASGIIKDKEKVDAFAHVAEFIATAFTSAYQQEEVAKYLVQGNDAMANATEGLAVVVEEDYPGRIDNEVIMWKQHFKKVEGAVQAKYPLEWENYAAVQWQARFDLDAKIAAARALAKSVRTIGKAHAELKKDAERLTGKEVYAAVRDYVNAAQPVLKEVQDAFAKK